ncbi:hypothetical protein EYZ11_012440 [Aspergillus tanneri]|uniref:Uncharacterized protein n=1 Tax=Aspergillus tanneri TaxID=1220188 RepID=A0A4S3J2C8_9EURO|nr:hypothetical protein EYZ11_012440 [Aspergillus tanneri]
MSCITYPHHRHFSPYLYTSSRCLLNDEEELDNRSIDFDFDALSLKITHLWPENGTIRASEKLEEGCNRVFVFVMNDGRRVVARAKKQLLYLYRTNALNPAGSEYLIMDHVASVQLHEAWPNMYGVQRIQCIGAIYELLKRVVKLDFPA